MSRQSVNSQMEARLAKLEAELSHLAKKVERDVPEAEAAPAANTKMRDFLDNVVGVFAGKPAFLEAAKLGAEWRASFRPKRRQPSAKKRGNDARARH